MLTQLLAVQHFLAPERPLVELCARLHEGRTLADRVRLLRRKRRPALAEVPAMPVSVSVVCEACGDAGCELCATMACEGGALSSKHRDFLRSLPVGGAL